MYDGNENYTHNFGSENLKERIHLGGRTWHRWEDIIKINLKDIGHNFRSGSIWVQICDEHWNKSLNCIKGIRHKNNYTGHKRMN
jgi:hypothetical protein